ncbi:hypothetical protein SAMN04515675_0265 [Pseudomonas costantinii]|uniref:Uncharacterized protein n=1 Tax=Pseudomonas costantinii TaxID=168469 RepID=A0A1H4YT85_9PSED|nr:hypothetical protein SAMN04515675_0265 [Pseudomonas costantinii]
MFFNTILKIRAHWVALFITLVGAVISPAKAETVEVAVDFFPDARRPTHRAFVMRPDTACPSSQTICRDLRSRAVNFFATTQLEYLESSNNQGSIQNSPDPLIFKAPFLSRRLTVTEVGGGDSQSFDFKITGMGATVVFVGGSNSSTDWAGNWFERGLRRCTQSAASILNNTYSFFWTFSSNMSCSSGIPSTSTRFNIFRPVFTYELVAENPLYIKPGTYRGSLTYTVGATNSDIIMGRSIMEGRALVPDPILTINFTLNVRPVFRVDIPSGGNRVELQPLEGWQSWLASGRSPSKLSKNQTFNVWSTSPFTIRLECARQVQGKCALQKNGTSRHLVPFNVGVSLPSHFVDGARSRVVKRELSPRLASAETFTPTQFIERAPAMLHFEVEREHVSEMLNNAGSLYSGAVTVVWETTI